jgi:hypothetical protein
MRSWDRTTTTHYLCLVCVLGWWDTELSRRLSGSCSWIRPSMTASSPRGGGVQLAIAGSTIERCSFKDQRIDSVQLGGGGQRQTLFRECSFDGSRWESTTLGDVRFERCSFQVIDAGPWLARKVETVDCTFSGRITDAVFWGRDPESATTPGTRATNEIAGNDFRECDLVAPAFRGGIDPLAQRLPVAPHYILVADAEHALSHAHAEISVWTDLEARRKAVNAPKAIRSDIATGQNTLFLDRRLRPAWLEALRTAYFGLFG